jgi:hypothetical protein
MPVGGRLKIEVKPIPVQRDSAHSGAALTEPLLLPNGKYARDRNPERRIDLAEARHGLVRLIEPPLNCRGSAQISQV